VKRQVVIATDIFGICAGIDRLAQDLAKSQVSVTIIDPYQSKPQAFCNEQQAYSAFVAYCGHDLYAQRLSHFLQSLPENQPAITLAIGFSAGASALWRALATVQPGIDSRVVKQAVLFYPGQIHHYAELQPHVPVHIVFGQCEPHFDVGVICQQLQQWQGVIAEKTAFGHGFMNPASAAFAQTGYQQYLTLLNVRLTA